MQTISNHNEDQNHVKKLYTLLVTAFPMLSLYATPIPNVSVCDIVLMILLPFFFIQIMTENRPLRQIIIFPAFLWSLYLLLGFFILILSDSLSNNVFATFRYGLYLVCAVFFSRSLFLPDYFLKIIPVTTIYSCIYVIMQQVSYRVFHHIIGNTLFGLPAMSTSLSTFDRYQAQNVLFRPNGPFIEPSHCAQYLLLYFTYLALYSKWDRKTISKLIVCLLGILLTGSGLGLVTVVLLLGVKVIAVKRIDLNKLFFGFLFLIPVGIAFVHVANSNGFLTRSLERLTSGFSISGRFSTFSEGFSIFQSGKIVTALFGNGVGGLDNVFVPSFPLVFYNTGLIGAIITAVVLISIVLQTHGYGRTIWIVFLITQIASQFYFDYYWMIIVTLAYADWEMRQDGQIISKPENCPTSFKRSTYDLRGNFI